MAALQDMITAAQSDPDAARQLLGVFTVFSRRETFVQQTCRELIRAGVPEQFLPDDDEITAGTWQAGPT